MKVTLTFPAAKMVGKLLICCTIVLVLTSFIQANVLRCDLIDPHSNEAELCWTQLFQKNPSLMMQIVEDIPQDNPAVRVHSRNAELSSALMDLYKLMGKRNPDNAKDVLQLIGDMRPYKDN